VIAPLVALFGATPLPVVVAQALLAAATAALTAAAARRFGGNVAAWSAGLAVAFSAPLVHLDGYVAVSGLAAFLVAGACFACAPAEREGERGHGPLAAGVWLGLSALARPIVLFALPFVVLLFVRRSPRRLRAAALALLPFALCAGLSFARNAAVSGERVVFTAANGQNLYLGNNAAARRTQGMFTDEFRFAPREMHQDAKFRVGFDLGREPTRGEISDRFAALARRELTEHPGDSLSWYAQKARWFFSSEEPASSADIDWDRGRVPLLRLAFVPTWLVAALALAGAVAAWRSRGLLLGPGSLVVAHWAACTLTFPLSHYRSPAIPAMAVLAGCGVAAAWSGLRAGTARAAVLVATVAGLVAAVALLDPQPRYRKEQLLANLAVEYLHRGDLETAERFARESAALDPQFLGPVEALLDVARARNRPQEALPLAERLADAHPWNPLYVRQLSEVEVDLGRKADALTRMDRIVDVYPWSGVVRSHRGEIRCLADDVAGAREDFDFARAHGAEPPAWALEKCALPHK
jgi:4-amino-4-deoxy-L-arabinose transferase-like glycosyltransferase